MVPGHCEEFLRVAGQGVESHTCMAFPGKLNSMSHTVCATIFQMHVRVNKTHILLKESITKFSNFAIMYVFS